MSISFSHSGSFDNVEAFLKRAKAFEITAALNSGGQQGVAALAGATPTDTGETANSWYYEVVKESTGWAIIWGNSNVVDGVPIAVLIQTGHGTGTGGYVQGRDYINPALRPIFDQIANNAWKAVTG